MANYQQEIKKVEAVDLTGSEPVHEIKTIIRNIPVVNLDGKNDDKPFVSFSDPKVKLDLCEVCHKTAWKYCCPGCNTRTCSLLCVQKHKQKNNCTGQRDKTAFVSRSDFDNFHLLSDYRFLEETSRIADNAKRDYKSKGNTNFGKQWNILRNAAKKNGVNLFRIAKGMQRWKENRSRYHIKENTIYWTIKFVFLDIYEEVITKCSELESFEKILTFYINKDHCSKENVKTFSPYIAENNNVFLFFKHELKSGENNKKFTIVNLKDTVKDSLVGKSVLEYPVFVVALSTTAEDVSEKIFTKTDLVNVKSDEESSESDSEDEVTSPAKKICLRDVAIGN